MKLSAEVYSDHVLVYFHIKKEDRQKTVSLPSAPDECSISTDKWTYGNSKRTLYHTYGCFVLRIAI